MFRLSLVESAFGWVVSDRASARDSVGTVRSCVIRDFLSHRVMRRTCRIRSRYAYGASFLIRVVRSSCALFLVCTVSLVFRIAFLIRHRVISVDVCGIAAFVSVDPCVSRSRVGRSYSLFRVLRYLVRP